MTGRRLRFAPPRPTPSQVVFSLPPPILGPRLINFACSMVKKPYFKERYNVQFRAEFFNIFNRANFSSPVANDTLFDQTGAPIGGGGLINQTATTRRQIPFALKFIW